MSKASTTNFHEKFDGETLLKLKLFRAYVREWLPVFLAKLKYPYVNVFDFFAGPGSDAVGNPGSPLIVMEELRDFYATRSADPAVQVALHFFDKSKKKTARLSEVVEPFRELAALQIDVRACDFDTAYDECLPAIRDKQTANLVIVDQFGYRHMPPERFAVLAQCQTTDLLCFITSSQIKRFATEEAVQKFVAIAPEELTNVVSSQVHRKICDYYRRCLPDPQRYYVAPFSIKSNANVYGLMFGSGSLYGLEKFLKACWSLDEFTGEANFAIDADAIVANCDQRSLFEEDNVPKKQKEFAENLVDYLSQRPVTNMDIYRFTLESGFLPKQVNPLLSSMEKQQMIEVERFEPSRTRGYYVSWKDYREGHPKARYSMQAMR